MFKDGLFSKNAITEANMQSLSHYMSVESEKRICELSFLAEDFASDVFALIDEGYGIFEIFEMMSEGAELSFLECHSEALEKNQRRISSYLGAVSAEDRAVFCDLFFEALKSLGRELCESDFLQVGNSGENFVYVKNRLADEAYDVFSQDFEDPRVFYAESFREAARAVAQGKADYCLLPLEERGARLSGIEALLFSQDLKINSVTPVFGFDGSADMKYALVSKKFSAHKVSREDDRYLEIRLESAASADIAALFLTCEYFGVDLYRVNTSLFDTDEGKVTYLNVVLSVNGADFTRLLICLTLFFGAYEPVGLYNNLE